jgi:hypothetical protein
MKGFVAVLQREIFERRLLALVAFILGLVPLALPLAPGLLPEGFSAEDLRSGLAIGLAALLTALFALFLGGSIIVGDLAERRLGFYFARPLSGGAIWAGKIAAALVLVLGCGVLVLAPAAQMGIDSNPFGIQGFNLESSVALWSVGLLGLLLAAHAASLMVRSRSPWLLLDLVALGTVAGLYWSSSRRLILAGVGAHAPWSGGAFFDPRVWIAAGSFLVVLLALALAGLLQVVRGRTDLRRGHRVLSLSLWGTLIPAAAVLAGLSFWWIGGGPGDLRSIDEVLGAPQGTWVALVGSSSRIVHYQQGFLYDLGSGRSVRTGFGTASIELGPQVRFSADGRRVVWLAYDGVPFNSPLAVFRLDLDRAGARPVRTQISYPVVPRSLALSPDGRRLADYGYYAQKRVTVSDVDTGRLLAAAELSSTTGRPGLAFADAGHLRLYDASLYDVAGVSTEARQADSEILELDLASRAPRFEVTGHLRGALGFTNLSLSPAGDRALVRGYEGLRLCDARTGEMLAPLGDRKSTGSFLADGRIAVLSRVAGGRELRVFAPDGRSELRRFAFPGAWAVVVGDPSPSGQPAPDLLRIAVSAAPPSPWEVRLLDLASGGSQSLGVRKLLSPGGERSLTPGRSLARADGLLWFDPASFRERMVLKGP